GSKGTNKESSNGIWLPERHNLAKQTCEHQLQDSHLVNLRKTNYVIRNRNKSRKYCYQKTAEKHGNEVPTNHHSSMSSSKKKKLARSRCKNGEQPLTQNSTNSKAKHKQATGKTTKTIARELDLQKQDNVLN
ncbi:hypothetical protein M0802_014288, partial [Mischocyttarus mexicanus]